MKYIDLQQLLFPLRDEQVIGRSVKRYLNVLVAQDIENRLQVECDEFTRVLMLEVLVELYEDVDADGRLDDVVAELSRLKKKHRSRLQRLRDKVMRNFMPT